ncbi:MAG TPA: adenylyltransferase, partial [Elusimicrobiota bacterium]|nr:adenylyltransferase [Elusimicrobiota bacterium]
MGFEMAAALNTPYGGKLVDRMSARSRDEILREAAALPDVVLGTRQICDLELILNGGFSPLTGFMGKAAYEGVVSSMRLPQGRLWPMPITLDVDPETAKRVSSAGKAALRSPEGSLLAILSVSDVWTPDRAAEAQAVFGTIDPLHPGAAYLLQR